MAAGLAARINHLFGLDASFIEGHNGVFDMRLNGEVIYTNRSECGRLPEPSDIARILEERGFARKEGADAIPSAGLYAEGIFCPLPAAEKEVEKGLPLAGDGCLCNDKE